MDCKEGVLLKRYELGKLLGQGNFAKVYHARNLETGMSVAVKVIDKAKVLKAGMMDQIKREISVMRLVKHPNVVQLHEVMATKTKIHFVLEYVKGGELFDNLTKGKLKEEAARRCFQQLVSAIDFCHNRGVYHRDLKPENLLVDDDGNLKVSDFGLSAFAETKRQDGLLHTACGTPAYVAPEVIHGKGYHGAKADIWSCGVVLFVLLAGFLPFHDSNLMEMYRKIARAEFKYPKWFPTEPRRLVSKMLDPNPETRISIAKIMESSWFTKGLNYEPETSTMVSGFDSIEASNLNAFDIISFSRGFDLTGLFNDDVEDEKEVRFMSRKPATTIILKLEEIAKGSKLQVMKNNGTSLKLEESQERNGVLAVGFEIFEITSNVHLVEVKRLRGDRFEFKRIMHDRIRPTLTEMA